jgi:outer membrane receptor protein involved in Fe transport
MSLSLSGRYSPARKIPYLLALSAGLLLLSPSGRAQALIHGIVADRSDKPIAGANVLLLLVADSALVKGTIAGEKGVYSFANVKPGNYILAFSGIGFEQKYSPGLTIAGRENRDMGIQKLTESKTELATVTVAAKKPLLEQKIDRLIINVQGNITAAGSTVLDVLERSPGVIVDRQNNSISLSGKNGVVVMINGKINHMPLDAVIQMLAGMSAGNIDKIELITTPPASLDAEGNAGYINIVLKENNQYGTNGSYSLSMGYGNREMPQANISMNHRQGKFNIYGDYSFSRVHAEQDWNFYHLVANGGKVTETGTDTYRNTVRTNHNGRLGLDYQLNRKTVIGVLLSGYSNKWTMNANNAGNIIVNGVTDTILTIANTEKNLWTNYEANINLQHTFSDKEKLSLNADFIHYLDDNPNNYSYAYYDGSKNFLFNKQTQSTKNTPIRFWVNAADYSRKLGKGIDLEAGVKSTVSSFRNDVQIDNLLQNAWVKDPSLSARYKLQEDIEAAYASVDVAAGPKTDLKGGLRYEYTNSNLGSDSLKNIVDRHYGYLFPSLFITRRLNDNHSLSFSYSRRITRPTFNDMAPFVIFIDPSTFFSGNPALQPSLSDAVKADYTYKKYIFSVSYTYEKSPIANFNPTIDSATNIETLSAVNLISNKTVALVLAIPLDPTPWWSLSFNATGIWQQTSAVYNNSFLRLNQENININTTQTFRLPKDLSVEVSGFYQTAGLFGLYKAAPFGSLDIGVQKKLNGKRGTLRLTYSDILNTLQFKIAVNRPDQNLVLSDRLAFVFPAVRLTWSRSFGNDKLRAKRERSTGSEDEEGRVHY